VQSQNQLDLMWQILLIVEKSCECVGHRHDRCSDRANGLQGRKTSRYGKYSAVQRRGPSAVLRQDGSARI
jgi:hypothetical protein